MESFALFDREKTMETMENYSLEKLKFWDLCTGKARFLNGELILFIYTDHLDMRTKPWN